MKTIDLYIENFYHQEARLMQMPYKFSPIWRMFIEILLTVLPPILLKNQKKHVFE
jgi:hypothetical protein